MEAFYWTPPTAEQLDAWKGMTLADFPEPNVEVWEENWDVMCLFITYQSQWRMGPGGPIGLDFEVFHHALDRKGVKGDEYDQYISDLNVIQTAALKEMRK